MCQLLARPVGRFVASVVLTTALLALASCGDLAAALPARPTPVPTMARLPSVTPVTPSPTAQPTSTSMPLVTPTAVPLQARVAVAANVRGGPGTDFPIVGVLDAGTEVQLLQRDAGWYQIAGPVEGWMFGQVLTIDSATDAAVPTAVP